MRTCSGCAERSRPTEASSSQLNSVSVKLVARSNATRRGTFTAQTDRTELWPDQDHRRAAQAACGGHCRGAWLGDLGVCRLQPDPAGWHRRVVGTVANLSVDGRHAPQCGKSRPATTHATAMHRSWLSRAVRDGASQQPARIRIPRYFLKTGTRAIQQNTRATQIAKSDPIRDPRANVAKFNRPLPAIF